MDGVDGSGIYSISSSHFTNTVINLPPCLIWHFEVGSISLESGVNGRQVEDGLILFSSIYYMFLKKRILISKVNSGHIIKSFVMNQSIIIFHSASSLLCPSKTIHISLGQVCCSACKIFTLDESTLELIFLNACRLLLQSLYSFSFQLYPDF